MRRAVIGSILLALLALLTLAAPAAAAPPPDTLQAGGQRLELVGHGTRNAMLFIELYAVALYLPRAMSDPGAIRDAQVPKALRVEIRYDGSLPDRIPSGWRSELMPVLSPEQRETLRRRYEQLQPQDVITITYVPDTGTTVAVNGQAIIEDAGDAIVNAFLEVWIGPQPVSEDLKQSLL